MSFTTWLRRLNSRLSSAVRPTARRRPARPSMGRTRPRLEALEDRLMPSTGGLLDPTFGSGGQVLSSLASSYDNANAVAVQPDGKIVIAGTPNFLVARYNADGSLDAGFGAGGHTVTSFNGFNDQAWAVAVQPQADGTDKIVVAGITTITVKSKRTTSYYDLYALARYNADGTLDTTFGNNGKVTTDLGSSSWVYAMAVDGAGRIVVAGETGGGAAELVRYSPNGALDASFGSGGKLVTSMYFGTAVGQERLALQPDGKIDLAGTQANPANSTAQFVVARFNANGTADSSFGSSGVTTTPLGAGENLGGIAIQGDGKIVVDGGVNFIGVRGSTLYLLRYNPDGTPDAGFGSNGVAADPFPSLSAIQPWGSGVAVQSDGRIVACGLLNRPSQPGVFAAARVNPDGSVDTGYGNGGWATVLVGYNGDRPQASALEPDGRLVVAGYANPTANFSNDVALVRILPSAPQIGSFLASLNPVTSGSSTTLTASNITDGNPNSTVTQVAFYVQVNGTNTLLGYGTQTSPGVWSFTYTVNLAAGSYTLLAQAEDSYGALGDPFALTLTVQ
jgi:uncharacterized delta-60 repeat protein